MECRILGLEGEKEEIDSLDKDNIKCTKVLTQSIQRIWDTMKRSNLKVIEIEK